MLDHDKKPLMMKSIEYEEGFASKECKTPFWKERSENLALRKYHVKEVNGFIYVWIHVDPTVNPYFEMIDGE